MAVIDKVRGSKKTIKTILKNLDKTGIKGGETSILLRASDKNVLDDLRAHMNERKMNFIECEVGCVVGTHSGEGACGIFYVEDY